MSDEKDVDTQELELTPEQILFAEKVGVEVTKSYDQSIEQIIEKINESGSKALHQTADPDDESKSFGDWLLQVRMVPEGSSNARKRLSDVYGSVWVEDEPASEGTKTLKAALAEGSGITGGYTVPPEFRMELFKVAAEESIVRSRATIIPMRRRSLSYPMLDVTTAPTAGQSAFFGGVIAYWTAEAATKTETEPTFKQGELVAHKLAGYTLASDEILDDSAVGLEALLYQLFGGAVAWYEDYAFLRGTGVGQPLGVVNSGAMVGVTKKAATDFRFPDVAGCVAKLLPQSYPRSVWIVSPSVLPKIYQMSTRDASGGTAADSLYMTLPGGVDGTSAFPMQLAGRPVLVSEKLPALGSDYSVLLCDFSFYLIGDRQQLEIAASPHYKFVNDQMTWRFVHRVDGQPWLDSYITLADASTTVTPFVFVDY